MTPSLCLGLAHPCRPRGRFSLCRAVDFDALLSKTLIPAARPRFFPPVRRFFPRDVTVYARMSGGEGEGGERGERGLR